VHVLTGSTFTKPAVHLSENDRNRKIILGVVSGNVLDEPEIFSSPNLLDWVRSPLVPLVQR
jgi:hypothetical protein